ncbi:Uncharacterized protein Fot_08806 [Forsythia ovata]|uniref:Uncharacterized protein n=1 Tax=Forsythia ovata TaxID=205694 RepID=A0ABD1WZ99_9LAMI
MSPPELLCHYPNNLQDMTTAKSKFEKYYALYQNNVENILDEKLSLVVDFRVADSTDEDWEVICHFQVEDYPQFCAVAIAIWISGFKTSGGFLNENPSEFRGRSELLTEPFELDLSSNYAFFSVFLRGHLYL